MGVSTRTEPRYGTAAGVPYLAVPPESADPSAPLVLAWHAIEPPRGEAALAGTFPLSGLNAWRVYLGLPMFGGRFPDDGVVGIERLAQADYLVRLLAPVVRQAVTELDDAVAELRQQLGVEPGPVGLFGIGAGATAALMCLLQSAVPFAAIGAVNPVIDPYALLRARERRSRDAYTWSAPAHRAATWLDLGSRTTEVGARPVSVPLLLVTGTDDEASPPHRARQFHDALVPYYTEHTLRHVTIPDLTHAIGPEPGLEPGPPTPGGVIADRALGEWFHLHLTSAAETTHRLRRRPPV